MNWWTSPSVTSHCLGVSSSLKRKRLDNKESSGNDSDSSGQQVVKWRPSIYQQFENQMGLGYPTYTPTDSLFNLPYESKEETSTSGSFGILAN